MSIKVRLNFLVQKNYFFPLLANKNYTVSCKIKLSGYFFNVRPGFIAAFLIILHLENSFSNWKSILGGVFQFTV
jgi:hypothetical protein